MSRDDQSIPTIISRGREIPLRFVKPDRKLTWDDIPDDAVAITNMDMDAILFKDWNNIICLLKTAGGNKHRRHDAEKKTLTKEWIHNYSILYITAESMAEKDVREKNIYTLGRIKDEGSNMKRCVNNQVSGNDDVALATFFPKWLNHTVKEEDPYTPYLFEVRYGRKRSLTPIQSFEFSSK